MNVNIREIKQDVGELKVILIAFYTSGRSNCSARMFTLDSLYNSNELRGFTYGLGIKSGLVGHLEAVNEMTPIDVNSIMGSISEKWQESLDNTMTLYGNWKFKEDEITKQKLGDVIPELLKIDAVPNEYILINGD